MANLEHVERLKQGVDGWNAWRNKNPESPDLSLANLNGAGLSLANLYDTLQLHLFGGRLLSSQFEV